MEEKNSKEAFKKTREAGLIALEVGNERKGPTSWGKSVSKFSFELLNALPFPNSPSLIKLGIY